MKQFELASQLFQKSQLLFFHLNELLSFLQMHLPVILLSMESTHPLFLLMLYQVLVQLLTHLQKIQATLILPDQEKLRGPLDFLA